MSSTGVVASNAPIPISVLRGFHEASGGRAQILQTGARLELLHMLDKAWIAPQMLMIRRVRQRAEHGGANIFVVAVIGHNPPPDRRECLRVENVQARRAHRPNGTGLGL